jgi:ubiquinone/menaquinone biosynthesis C-methylase UbiE
MPKPRDVYYAESVFRARSLADARHIILTPSGGQSTDERWQRETPYVVELVAARLHLTSGSTVLDYGCGIGRVAKGLIERTGCSVVGVDISPEMRTMAKTYVASPRFAVHSPEAFRFLVKDGLRVDAAISIWVLQHVADPRAMLGDIAGALKVGGRFFLLNDHVRHVPTNKGWLNDGIDQRQAVAERFTELETGTLAPEAAPEDRRQRSFWAVYRRSARP